MRWHITCSLHYVFWEFSGSQICHIVPEGTIHKFFAVELKTGPRFGGFCVKNWSKSCVKNWSKIFTVFPMFIVLGGAWLKSQIVSIGAQIVFSKYCQDVKTVVSEEKIAFGVFAFS